MQNFSKTALENAVLSRLHDLHGATGFPPVEMVRVIGREDTPCGRYVDLECETRIHPESGYLDLGGSHIRLGAVPDGIMAVAKIDSGKLTTLEFTTYGGESWDGCEDGWELI